MRGRARESGAAASVRAAAEAVTLADLGAEALPSLERALGAHRILLFRYDEGAVLQGVAGDLPRSEPEVYFAGYYATDPLHVALRRWNLPVMLPGRCPELARYDAEPAYNEFYRPRDLDHLLLARLTPGVYNDPGMVGLIVFRGRAQGDFDERAARTLERVMPSFEAAVRRSARVEAALGANAALGAMLAGADPRARLALDGAGRLLWASPRAEALLGSALGAEPPAALVQGARRLAALARSPGQALDAPASTFTAALALAGGARLAAHLRLARRSSGEPFVEVDLEEPRALGARPRGEGLTAAEAHVLDLLVQGLGNAQIAERLFVSVATVKTHLQRIYRKLGVTTRSQAILVAIERRAAPGGGPRNQPFG